MIEPTKASAYWHEKFVEIKNPHKENEVFRFYFDQPRREWVDLGIEEVDPICEKYKDQPYKLYVEIRNLLKDKNT
jgi:hypothetical protein